MNHVMSKTCQGEICSVCHSPATHKVSEEIPFEDTIHRHEFTAYVCCLHFRMIFGPRVFCQENHDV
jgi:hypothetical protein